MAEKLETRSELFNVEKLDNADDAKLGYSVVQNTGALILTAQYPEGFLYQKIQVNLPNGKTRYMTRSGSWTEWMDSK